MKNLEHRTIVKELEFREDNERDGIIGTLHGYAAVFDSDSVEFAGWDKPWVERIERGAFKRTLSERGDDVVALWSHDSAEPIARAPKTLKLSEDERGLKAEIELIDTQRNRDLLNQIRNGIVDAMSFGFEVKKQEWDDSDKERAIRTLKDVELYEVSPVVWPAYPDTTIAARSLEKFLQAREEEEPEAEEQSVTAPLRDLWRARLGTNK